MIKHVIGILDYGAGNCTSVNNTINKLNFRTRLIKCEEDFKKINLLLIPGVGAFPSAMEAINKLKLIEPIHEYAKYGNPIVGVCLGMQLLADCSYELGFTQGLGLIPGEVQPLAGMDWHIGWNNLEVINNKAGYSSLDGASYYFNHSYEFRAAKEYVVGIARNHNAVVAMVKKANICGVQFHPEKSQSDGLELLSTLINSMISDKESIND